MRDRSASAALACDVSRPESTTRAPGASSRAIGVRQPLQRAEQDIGEHEVERPALAKAPRAETGGVDDRHAARRGCAATFSRATCAARGSMSLASTGRCRRPGGGNREHAGSGADVEDAARAARLEQAVERQQASPRGAVMAGAEGERRLDLDADAVGADARRGSARCGRRSGRPRPA